MNIFLNSLIIAIFVLPYSVFGASFDCKLADTKIERLICSNPDLSSLDEEMAANYEKARRYNPNILHEQKAWLKKRNLCRDATCLQVAYSERIQALSAMASSPDNRPLTRNESTPHEETSPENRSEAKREADRKIEQYEREAVAESERPDKENLGRCLIDDPKQVTYDSHHEVFNFGWGGCPDGGNHSEEYLMLVTLKNGKWIASERVHIGGRNDVHNFQSDSIAVRNSIIYMTGKAWGRNDSSCCPTIPKTRKFTIANDRINAIN